MLPLEIFHAIILLCCIVNKDFKSRKYFLFTNNLHACQNYNYTLWARVQNMLFIAGSKSLIKTGANNVILYSIL